MRVLHVITRLVVGGAQENTVTTVLGLARKPDLEVGLISGPSLGPEGSMEAVVNASPGLLRVVPELVRPVHPWKDIQALRKLTAIFRREQPEIVHTHSSKAGVLGRLAASRARVPIIVHTIHGPSFGPFQGRIANTVFRAAEVRAARVTTHFIVVADAMRDQFLQAGIGRPECFTRILSGFDLVPFLQADNDLALRASLGLSPENVVIGKVARLFPLKGHDDLLDVSRDLVQKVPSLRFMFVGGGGWEERLKQRAAALGLAEKFVFTGLVPPERVASLIGIMDVLVHASRREGLARALPQALAAGKPVVAYNCDGASEVCLPGKTGFLVRPGDLDELKSSILKLASDPALRNRLGQQGRTFVGDRFTADKMVEDIYALYRRLLARP